MKQSDHSWLGIAALIAVVLVVLGSVVSLYVQTWLPMLIVAVVVGLVLVISAASVAILDRFWRTPQPWECPFCGYDRRGLLSSAACPECGRAPDAMRP